LKNAYFRHTAIRFTDRGTEEIKHHEKRKVAKSGEAGDGGTGYGGGCSRCG
jgi:hypothetical protein